MPAKVICGFVDAEVNRLLDVDPEREVAFSLVALGHVAALPEHLPSNLSALHLETVPLSRSETVYPAMHEIHTASSLNSAEEVATWRGNAPRIELPAPTGPVIQLHPYSDTEMPRDPIERVILRRGSARKFGQVPIDLPQFSTMLDRATRGVPADFLDPQGSQLNQLYLIVHAGEGLDPGADVFRPHRSASASDPKKDQRYRQPFVTLYCCRFVDRSLWLRNRPAGLVVLHLRAAFGDRHF